MAVWYEENDNYETNIHSINKREKLEILIIIKLKEVMKVQFGEIIFLPMILI